MPTRTFESSLRNVLLSSLLLSTPSVAQFAVDSLSFGHGSSLSQNGRSISGWQIAGEAHTPQVLSDRIILTPPAPGHARGAIWADQANAYPEWTAELEFRASGPERGSGNLQIWFTKDTRPASAMASVYTVDQFDGLALVLDQYGGAGGSVRGFLNDGSISYKNHHSVDSLSFGHCVYPYRNLGRPSKVRLRHGNDGFEVLVDDQSCFKSDMVRIPAGYNFGISAASAETPDSFEINKFVVSTTSSGGSSSGAESGSPPPPPPPPPQVQDTQVPGGSDPLLYGDLLNRLANTQQTLDTILREISGLESRQNDRHNELKNGVPKSSQFEDITRRLQTLESTTTRIQRDIEGRDYQQSLSGLEKALKDTQANLLSSLPQSMSQIVTTSAPKMWVFLIVLLGFQAVLAGCYVYYKQRRSNSPKKLL